MRLFISNKTIVTDTMSRVFENTKLQKNSNLSKNTNKRSRNLFQNYIYFYKFALIFYNYNFDRTMFYIIFNNQIVGHL